jgi:hypothetical protein
MPNPYNDPAAERSNKRVLSTARAQAAARAARLEETERELRLARLDIDNPRPEHWEADLARYRAAKVAFDAARVGLPREGNSFRERMARLISARDAASGATERRSLSAAIATLRLSR